MRMASNLKWFWSWFWCWFLKEAFDFWFCRKKKPILRPPISTHITCSIHCPNASGYPQLSCVSCQSLYHPACVGLGPTISDYLAYDFYCSTCQPPSGKENKPFTLGNSSTTITSALGSTASPKVIY